MRVKIVKPFAYAFRGCDVVQFDAGDQDVPQEVADLAILEGWAESAEPVEKAKPAHENKMARAPRNKAAK